MEDSFNAAPLVHRVQDLRKQKEVARREYERAMKALHQAEQSETCANSQLQSSQRQLQVMETRREVEARKRADEELRRQRLKEQEDEKKRRCAQEQEIKILGRQQREAQQSQRQKEAEDAKQRHQQLLEDGRRQREQEQRLNAEVIASMRAQHDSAKWTVTKGMMHHLGSLSTERKEVVKGMVEEYRARAELDEEWRQVLNQQRSQKRLTVQLTGAKKRALVAKDTIQRIQAEEREAETLAKQMQHLKQLERAAAMRMMASERKVQALNASLMGRSKSKCFRGISSSTPSLTSGSEVSEGADVPSP